jgi:hypothetical protein
MPLIRKRTSTRPQRGSPERRIVSDPPRGAKRRLSNAAQGERQARAIDTEACSHSPLDVGHDDASERQRSPEKDPCEERHVTHSPPGRDVAAAKEADTLPSAIIVAISPGGPLLALEFAGFCRFYQELSHKSLAGSRPAHPHLSYRIQVSPRVGAEVACPAAAFRTGGPAPVGAYFAAGSGLRVGWWGSQARPVAFGLVPGAVAPTAR